MGVFITFSGNFGNFPSNKAIWFALLTWDYKVCKKERVLAHKCNLACTHRVIMPLLCSPQLAGFIRGNELNNNSSAQLGGTFVQQQLRAI